MAKRRNEPKVSLGSVKRRSISNRLKEYLFGVFFVDSFV